MKLTLTLTGDQAMMIRHAMCDYSMKNLMKAFDTQEELKKLGREEDTYIVDFHYKQSDEAQAIIAMIDKEWEEA